MVLVRAVIDTNVLVSALIKPIGTVGQVLQYLRVSSYVLIYSEQLLTELVDVLNRPRIREKYGLSSEDIEIVVSLILLRGESVIPKRRITICRDSKDNMFLEAAVDGNANMIVTGDDDLLSLDKFEGIPIITPFEFLKELD